MIIGNFKFFKNLFSGQSYELEYGKYSEVGDVKYSFSQNYSYYPSEYSSSDVCQDYLTPNIYCQKYITTTETRTYRRSYNSYYNRTYTYTYRGCSENYTLYRDFCYETCGDGYIASDPQTMPCDDGNYWSEDGCSSDCTVEEGYSCTITELNKSYCIKDCGSGIFDPTKQECNDGNNLNGDGCDSNCKKEDNYTCTNTVGDISYCEKSCGNGVRENLEECDDKNSMSYDGCDSSCKLEFNYECKPDASGVDVCHSKYFPPIILKNAHNSQIQEITYTFNDTMKNVSFTDEDIGCEFYGPSSDYTVSCNAALESDSKLKIKYSISPPIIGGVGELLLVKFYKVESFKSENLIPISTSFEYKYQFTTVEASEQAQATGEGASYTFVFSFGVSLVVSVLTGGSMELMWSLANTLQIVFILGLLNLYYPPNLSVIFSYLKYSNFDNPVTQALSSFAFKSINIIDSPISAEFEKLGFSSTNFLKNSLDKVFLLLLLGLFVLIIYLMFRCLKKKSTWFAKKIQKLDLALRYQSCTRLIVEMSMNLSVSAFINIFYDNPNGTIGLCSYILAVSLLILMAFIAIYVTIFPIYFYIDIKIVPHLFERHSFLFKEFQASKPECLYYYSYFIIRRILMAGVIVCLRGRNLIQLICMVILFYSVCKYQLVYRPFKCQVTNFLSCVNETFLLMFCFILFAFESPGDPTTIQMFGFVAIGFLAVFFILNWGVIFPLKIKDFCSFVREKCRKKTLEEKEEEHRKRAKQTPSLSTPESPKSSQNPKNSN
ncbi:unnamed protein product [Moneuplotes crassus]|uniref:Uncharacterized protein n=1 Tax=Euplotes crassus TaxID=5936 RepID=A0AAD1U473_EUPCR|nr:unnamed protein product [Moneuplotes crassus]